MDRGSAVTDAETTPAVKLLTARPSSRKQIGHAIYGPSLDEVQINALSDFYKYYDQELQLLYRGISTHSWQAHGLAVQSCGDLFRTIDVLQQNCRATRPQIRQSLEHVLRSHEDHGLNMSINLALRLWLMINVQVPQFNGLRLESTCVQWDDTIPLQDFVESLFPKSRWKLNAQSSRLGPHFTVAFMHRVCGLEIEWTTSLHDHLHLDRRRKALKIFPYKCHLQGLIAAHQANEARKPPIPLAVLRETQLSLDLLFPFWEPQTLALLTHAKQTFHEQGPFETARTLTLLDFEHWRDRLLELHDEVFRSPPVSWAQLWRDRRNPQQFSTFWVALVILLLTIVATVATVVQAWAAVKALKYIE